ncbi:MAG: cupin domain-containing protein [Elusimicrobia bacterium]|nr:cupin domain-containing protein [Elusimicrobiota bacterium]
MQKVHNLKMVPDQNVDDPKFRSPMMTKHLGALAGSERLYVNIDYVKPGGKSVKYHAHSLQEEFFLILAGTGKLRLQGRMIPIKAGDFFAKPSGKGIAHQFINDGKTVLEILDCGTADRGDIVEYPDENVVLLRDKRVVLKGSGVIANWSSDPNE